MTFGAPPADMELDRDRARDDVERPGGACDVPPAAEGEPPAWLTLGEGGYRLILPPLPPSDAELPFCASPWVVVVGGTFKELELDVC